jgi:hypothetical protein
MTPEPTDPELVSKMKTWLGDKGIAFFREIKKKHGTLLAVWMEGGIPHAVHFREGMQIRNKLRDFTQGSWTCHEYDDNWTTVIEACIEE